MTQLCPLPKVPCGPPCPDDQPVLNLSAEGPDNEVYVGVFDFPFDPPIIDNFSQLGCKSWCYSSLSQADADHCAEVQAVLCGGGTLIGNDVQSVSCPPGKICVLLPGGELDPQYTINGSQLILAPGTYTDLTKDLANTAAQQQLQQFFDLSLTSQPALLACQTPGGGGGNDPWTFSYGFCGDSGIDIGTMAGVTGNGTAMVASVSNELCRGPDGFCGPGATNPFEIRAAGCLVYHTFGPYATDKFISITGLYQSVTALHSLCGGAPFATIAQFTVAASDLDEDDYTGDFAYSNPSDGTDNGSFTVSGTLPAGVTTTISLLINLLSNQLPPVTLNVSFGIAITP